jgi:uncharacterized peroxidase-related enzyme
MGYLPNYSRTFSLNPAAYQGWKGLISSISGGMDLRRYELATLGAALALRSSYCSLAHGRVLVEKFFLASDLQKVVEDPDRAPLDEVERAVIDLASKVVSEASTVTEADIERLRTLGCNDREIFDVILTAAARSFFSKVLDATGTLADNVYVDHLEPGLREALTVGRPIDAPASA